MWERIKEIIRKEFRQTFRDPRTRVLLFGPPIIQLIVFGYAVNLDVRNAKIALLDMDRSEQSRSLLADFRSSRYFEVVAVLTGDREIQNFLNRGEVQAVVRIFPGFARDISRGNRVAVQIIVDGTDSNTAGIISGYVDQIVAEYAEASLQEEQDWNSLPRRGAWRNPRLSVQPRVWFNPNLKSREYFVPGVIVNIIALVTVMLTAMSIVREKEIGTIEQLMVTPVKPIELMLGKLLPFALVGLFEVALVTAAALLVFQVPFRGSPVMLVGTALLFLLTTLGIGLFISTVSETQQQAMMSSFFFFMPALLLSGFAFPIRNMPPAVRYLTYLNPLRYFMEIVRGVFLKGTGLTYLWPQMLSLLALGSAVLILSALRFRKRLD